MQVQGWGSKAGQRKGAPPPRQRRCTDCANTVATGEVEPGCRERGAQPSNVPATEGTAEGARRRGGQGLLGAGLGLECVLRGQQNAAPARNAGGSGGTMVVLPRAASKWQESMQEESIYKRCLLVGMGGAVHVAALHFSQGGEPFDVAPKLPCRLSGRAGCAQPPRAPHPWLHGGRCAGRGARCRWGCCHTGQRGRWGWGWCRTARLARLRACLRALQERGSGREARCEARRSGVRRGDPGRRCSTLPRLPCCALPAQLRCPRPAPPWRPAHLACCCWRGRWRSRCWGAPCARRPRWACGTKGRRRRPAAPPPRAPRSCPSCWIACAPQWAVPGGARR